MIKGVPKGWEKSKCASKDWLYGFMRRHRDLALRKPMGTTLGRATTFNRHNVKTFFEKILDVIQRFGIHEHNIWNMDEQFSSLLLLSHSAECAPSEALHQVSEAL